MMCYQALPTLESNQFMTLPPPSLFQLGAYICTCDKHLASLHVAPMNVAEHLNYSACNQKVIGLTLVGRTFSKYMPVSLTE